MVIAQHCHAELVSASILPTAPSVPEEKWTLKQVQGDGSSKMVERRQTQPDRQIMPVGVLAFDQVDLPLPMPTLELLLPQDCRLHVAEQLVTDQAVDLVAAGEAFHNAISVLPKPADQIAGDANVKRAIGLASEDINAGLALLPHGSEDASPWMLKQVQHDGIGDFSVSYRHPELISGSIGRMAL